MALKPLKYIEIDDQKGALYSAGKQSLLVPITFLKTLDFILFQLAGREGADVLISKIGEALGGGYVQNLEKILKKEKTEVHLETKIMMTCNAIFMEAGWGQINIQKINLKEQILEVKLRYVPSAEFLEKSEYSLERGILTGIYKEIAKEEVYCYLLKENKKNHEIILRVSKKIPGEFLAKEKMVLVSRRRLEEKVKEKTEELQKKIEELKKVKISLLNILEDVKEAREKAEEEKNKTLAIIANFIDPIIVLDKDYKISMINPAATRVFGLSGIDLGRQVSTDNKFSMSNFKSIIKKDYEIKQISEDTKAQVFMAEEITLKDTSLKEIVPGATYKVITAKVLSVDNKQFGIMKIFYDTTREKAIDKMKSEFISIAAHQLRTPLSAIKWVIKMILDGDAGKLTIEQQELLNKGYLSNEKIIRLVNDLLNVSRIEEGKFGFNFKKIDFQEVLDAAISNVESLAAKNHQELMIKKPSKFPKIFLDKERMVMVMQNLLSNAVKYTPEYGKIQLIIKVDKQNLHVKINDQGVGIPAEDQPKLFSKFFRAANVVKLETEGTGLGLFMVKNIIEKHNGRVSLKSEEGRGTEVAFYIPINRIVNS